MSIEIKNRTVFSYLTKNANLVFAEIKTSMASMTEYSIPAPKKTLDLLKTKQSGIKEKSSGDHASQAHDFYESDKENLNREIDNN